MLQQEFGSLLIGFTAPSTCSKCNNSKPLLIYQEYVKSRGYVVIPLGTKYGGIFAFCHICEQKSYFVKVSPFFSQKKSMDTVLSELEAGREYTKQWCSGLDPEKKEALFKRLNALGAHQLVQFLGLPT